ncbi:LysE family translocator [Acuticoccus sediminis]|uniref:LysE family translocator n=1 Tax=Acuticoccus sediminis TaxID=2184697 RepID=UPI001CFD2A83|nr:LysE family translocator [Acuticoccus sediminis]
MADPSSLMAFYIAALALILSPGPDMLLIVARGIGQGRRVALLTAAGTTLVAALVQLPLLALGVASLVAATPFLFLTLKWAGAVYLIWLGLRCLARASKRRTTPAAVPPVSNWAALRTGAVSNLTNPKPMMFLLAFLPQFVDPAGDYSPGLQLLILGATLKFTSFVLMSCVALGAGGVGGFVARRTGLLAWQERLTGAVMLGLGVRLLWADARV